jgi:hypothetical protein
MSAPAQGQKEDERPDMHSKNGESRASRFNAQGEHHGLRYHKSFQSVKSPPQGQRIIETALAERARREGLSV